MRKQSRSAASEAARERKQEYNEGWKAANTERVTIRLNVRTDADILAKLDGVESKQGEIKRLTRLGIKAEEARQDD